MRGLVSYTLLIISLLLFSSDGINPRSVAKELQSGVSRVIVVKGDEQFIPFEYVNDKGEPDGFNVELFKTLMKRLGFKYTLKLDDWDKVQKELSSKKIDMVIGMLYSQAGAKSVRFGVPHSMISYCVVSRDNREFFNLGELKGKKIIVQRNDRSYDYAIEHKLTSDIIQSKSIAEGLKLLSSGVGDAFLSFDITALYYIKQLRLGNLIVHRLDIPEERYSFAVNTDNEELLYILNLGMQQMKIDGEYDKIYYKWFGIYEKAVMPLYIKIIIGVVFLTVIISLLFILLLRTRVRKATADLRGKNEEQLVLLDELKVAKLKAEESDRLKSAFLANMSHEIRTPLNAVVGFSNLMCAEECTLEESVAYKEIIKVNSNMLLKLVNDILDLSKIESGTLALNMRRVDIKTICNNVYASVCCGREEDGNVEVIEKISFNCIVNTDSERISQVITNFMNNALKFTKRGKIVISAIRYDEVTVEVAVSDTGNGIPAEELTNIFQRFTKLDSFAQGSGIGLAISKSIIEMLGGEIGVESEIGKGSKFWFRLPIFSLLSND
jgi:signal transduction histidine kinase